MRRRILLIWLSFLSYFVHGQNNCFLFPSRPINIISNASFEADPSFCASGYINTLGLTVPYWATSTNEMFTGYLNACSNFIIPDSIIIDASSITRFMSLYPIVPQPIPGGSGVAVIADFGYDGVINTYPFHKSYVSTCLTESLQKDSLYRLDFYLGFGTRGNKVIVANNTTLVPEISPSPEKITLFGVQYCTNYALPTLGCPEVGGWINLGSCSVSGKPGTWVKASIQFRAPQDLQYISLGPSCDTVPVSQSDTFYYKGTEFHTYDFSYFLDSLQLNKSTISIPTVQIVSGTPCSDTVILHVQPAVFNFGYNTQWYKNGVLLNNENNSTLTVNRENYGSAYYQCRVESDSACLDSDPFYVQLLPIPNPSVLGKADTVACLGDTVLLNAFTDTSFSYTWQDGSTQSYFSATQSGVYSVNVSNICGASQAQKTVNFQKCNFDLFIPNAFTPNGDGKNDLFKIRYIYPPSKFKINIYSRTGQQLFSSSDPSAEWNGNFKGKPQAVGTYIYEVEYFDHKNKYHLLKGTVELIR